MGESERKIVNEITFSDTTNDEKIHHDAADHFSVVTQELLTIFLVEETY